MKSTFFVLILLISFSSFASKGRDGGDLTGIYKKSIKSFIRNELKEKLIAITTWIRPADIKDPEVHEMIQKMYRENIKNDILSSKYIFASETPEKACITSDGVAKAATSTRGVFGGDICFDLDVLFNTNATSPAIIGLAMHEHAHHFGFPDKDEKTAKYFTLFADLATRKNYFYRERAIKTIKKQILICKPAFGPSIAQRERDLIAIEISRKFFKCLENNYSVKKTNIKYSSADLIHLGANFIKGRTIDEDKLAEYVFKYISLLPRSKKNN